MKIQVDLNKTDVNEGFYIIMIVRESVSFFHVSTDKGKFTVVFFLEA